MSTKLPKPTSVNDSQQSTEGTVEVSKIKHTDYGVEIDLGNHTACLREPSIKDFLKLQDWMQIQQAKGDDVGGNSVTIKLAYLILNYWDKDNRHLPSYTQFEKVITESWENFDGVAEALATFQHQIDVWSRRFANN